MWRAFFLAVGITLCVLGAECMVIDEAVISKAPAPAMATSYGTVPSSASRSRVVRPPEWAPWSLISAGTVIILYSFTLPQRMGG